MRAALDSLTALGYVDAPTEQERQAAVAAGRRQTFHLAVVHFDAGRPAAAAPLFEKLMRAEPQEATFALFLAACRFALGELDECRRLAWDALERAPKRAAAELILGGLALSEGGDDAAVEHLRRAERAEESWPDLLCLVGVLYLRLRRWGDAGRAFEAAARADPDCIRAHLGLAVVLLEQGRPEDAVEAALDAIRMQYRLSEAHHLLGLALARSGRPARAISALETCLALRPDCEGAAALLGFLRGRDPRSARDLSGSDGNECTLGPESRG
jgi:tetratricopeptide (TPR) repeat protein